MYYIFVDTSRHEQQHRLDMRPTMPQDNVTVSPTSTSWCTSMVPQPLGQLCSMYALQDIQQRKCSPSSAYLTVTGAEPMPPRPYASSRTCTCQSRQCTVQEASTTTCRQCTATSSTRPLHQVQSNALADAQCTKEHNSTMAACWALLSHQQPLTDIRYNACFILQPSRAYLSSVYSRPAAADVLGIGRRVAASTSTTCLASMQHAGTVTLRYCNRGNASRY
jgi:hypothetical protein